MLHLQNDSLAACWSSPARLGSHSAALLPALQGSSMGAATCAAEAAYLLQVTGGTSGDLSIPEDDLLGCPPTQGAHDASKDLLLADQGGILPGDEPGQPTSLPAGDEGHLLHGIVACKATVWRD